MTEKHTNIEKVVSQLETAKREIGALHLLMAGIIEGYVEGGKVYIPKNDIAKADKALKMSDDEDNFIIEVVALPSKSQADVV
jgi:hypothetical protein